MDYIYSEIYVVSSCWYLFKAWFKHPNKSGGIFPRTLTVFDLNALLHNFDIFVFFFCF